MDEEQDSGKHLRLSQHKGQTAARLRVFSPSDAKGPGSLNLPAEK